MIIIVLICIVLFYIFIIRPNFGENKLQKEIMLKQLYEERKKKEEDERRLIRKMFEDERIRSEMRYKETITIVYECENENEKFIAYAKRKDNTYVNIVRTNERFRISEEIRIPTFTLNKWSWYNETDYQKLILIRQTAKILHEKEQNKQNKQAEYLESLRIDYLYHITHKSNLHNILENGLLSHNEARNSWLTQVDIADNQVNERRSRIEPIYKRSIHDYVPLYFNPKNPMLYRRNNLQNEIIILAIDRNLLYQSQTLFTDGNAAADSTSFYSNPDNLSKLNWDGINAEYWNEIIDGKRIKCSEVLVFPKISINAIKKIFCDNQETKKFVERSLLNHNKIIVELKLNMFF